MEASALIKYLTMGLMAVIVIGSATEAIWSTRKLAHRKRVDPNTNEHAKPA